LYFDFCVNDAPELVTNIVLDTIFNIVGDKTYCTPRKPVTAGKTYFVYTTLGNGVICYDNHTFEVGQGDFIFMHPNEKFSYRCKDDTWHFWWFEFKSEQQFAAADTVYNLAVSDFVMCLFEQSLVYAKAGRWDISSTLFTSVCNILQHMLLTTAASKHTENLRIAEQYIRENIQTVTVGELSAHLQMSERTLRNMFYSTVELSPKQLISKIRLDSAQQLLENSLLSIEEIAVQLGFCSQFHLSRSFKERFGIPPLKYRKFFQR